MPSPLRPVRARLAGSRLMARVVWLVGWAAHYTSTYCLHGEHETCRLTCKLCDAPCACWCHRERWRWPWSR